MAENMTKTQTPSLFCWWGFGVCTARNPGLQVLCLEIQAWFLASKSRPGSLPQKNPGLVPCLKKIQAWFLASKSRPGSLPQKNPGLVPCLEIQAWILASKKSSPQQLGSLPRNPGLVSCLEIQAWFLASKSRSSSLPRSPGLVTCLEIQTWFLASKSRPGSLPRKQGLVSCLEIQAWILASKSRPVDKDAECVRREIQARFFASLEVHTSPGSIPLWQHNRCATLTALLSNPLLHIHTPGLVYIITYTNHGYECPCKGRNYIYLG